MINLANLFKKKVNKTKEEAVLEETVCQEELPSQEEVTQNSFGIGSYSIWPKSYEADLDKKYGLTLSKLKNGKAPEVVKNSLSKNVQFTEGYGIDASEVEEEILQKYRGVPGFCSMIIKDEVELEENVKRIHETSYCHYAIGKQRNFQGDFPNLCCGYSSRNLLLNLMSMGYSNASFFYNSDYDHAYVGLPFVLKEQKGFIIVDPTSDQLFNNKNKSPRNNTFVAFGNKWEYISDWKNKRDLFPSSENSSTFINLEQLKKTNGSTWENSAINQYFDQVFLNAIEVSL